MFRNLGDIGHRHLALSEKSIGFIQDGRHFERRNTGNRIAILDLRLVRRSKGDGDVLIAQQTLGLDRGYRILLDDLVRVLVQLQDNGDLVAGLLRKID